MRKLTLLFAGLVIVMLGGTMAKAADEALSKMDGDIVARFHFIGTARINADPVPVGLKKIGEMPVTKELRNDLLNKAATAPFRLLRQKLAPPGNNDYAPLLRPLLEDLLESESYAEMRGPASEVPEFMLAVRLSSDRAKAWRSSLATVLTGWTGIPVNEIRGPGFTGWELKKNKDPDVIRCLMVNDWVLFGWGSGDLRLQPEFLQLSKAGNHLVAAANGNLLDVMIDWPSIMKSHPIKLPSPIPARLPRMHLTVAARKDYLRPELIMQFPDSLNLKLEPWKIPTNMVHNPFVSFTVARGIAGWLSQLPEMKELHPALVPNQATVWSMNNLPFGTTLALPMPGASNYLVQIAPKLVLMVNKGFHDRAMTCEAELTNNHIVVNGGMPFMNPFLSAVHDTSGDYIMAGLFRVPLRPKDPPIPKELLATIMGNPKLVYYNWEINQVRISQWESIKQDYLYASGHTPPHESATAIKWLLTATTNLNNCQTEMSLTAPNELTVVRSAPVGFTALEMTALEYWFDAPDFPLAPTYPKQDSKKPVNFPPK